MKTETIVYCVVLFLLGMLLANMLKNVCGCGDVVEGNLLCSKENKPCCKQGGPSVCNEWINNECDTNFHCSGNRICGHGYYCINPWEPNY